MGELLVGGMSNRQALFIPGVAAILEGGALHLLDPIPTKKKALQREVTPKGGNPGIRRINRPAGWQMRRVGSKVHDCHAQILSGASATCLRFQEGQGEVATRPQAEPKLLRNSGTECTEGHVLSSSTNRAKLATNTALSDHSSAKMRVEESSEGGGMVS